MSPEIRGFLLVLKAIAIYLMIAGAVASIYYHLKRRDLFGGYIGGFVVAVIGALIGGFILDYFLLDITKLVLSFLAEGAGVNIIAGFLGAYGAVYLMNRLNHDKERKKY